MIKLLINFIYRGQAAFKNKLSLLHFYHRNGVSFIDISKQYAKLKQETPKLFFYNIINLGLAYGKKTMCV